jgi:hypothetical protein
LYKQLSSIRESVSFKQLLLFLKHSVLDNLLHIKPPIIIYLAICLALSKPLIYIVWGILYADGLPVGADPSAHVQYILHILLTGKVLVPYSQFPWVSESSGLGYYPSFFHALVAAIIKVFALPITATTVVNTLQAFMFVQYLVGIVGYALLIKLITDRSILPKFNGIKYIKTDLKCTIIYYSLLLLAFGLFIYSTGPIIKSFRDGTYGEIFAMWCVFPFYLYFLITKRWYVAAVVLSGIALIHNLGFIMSMAATISYFGSLLVSRDFSSIKKVKYAIPIFIILASPAIIYFYIPSLHDTLKGSAGTYPPYALTSIVNDVTPNLYYAGIAATILILGFDYKRLGWLAGWSGFYFLIFNSPLFAERFGRELVIPFGLTVGIFASVLTNIVFFTSYKSLPLLRYNTLFGLITVITITSVSMICIVVSYGYFNEPNNEPSAYSTEYAHFYSNTTLLNYHSPAFTEADQYFINKNNLDDAKKTDDLYKPKIVNFGMSPWIKTFSYGTFVPLEVVPREDSNTLAAPDRDINNELYRLLKPNNNAIIEKYNIQYVTISSLLNKRWYPPSYIDENAKLQNTTIPSNFRLEKVINGNEGESIKIYSIHS